MRCAECLGAVVCSLEQDAVETHWKMNNQSFQAAKEVDLSLPLSLVPPTITTVNTTQMRKHSLFWPPHKMWINHLILFRLQEWHLVASLKLEGFSVIIWFIAQQFAVDAMSFKQSLTSLLHSHPWFPSSACLWCYVIEMAASGMLLRRAMALLVEIWALTSTAVISSDDRSQWNLGVTLPV